MLIAALRDLQWRRKRFIIAIIGTSLVFAMTLVLTGLANGFRVEAHDTVDSLGVDTFVVKSGAVGPFLGSTPFPAAELEKVEASPGVIDAVPLVYGSTTISTGSQSHNVNTFGAPADGPGMPEVSEGRAPQQPDEIAVSSTMKRRVGENLEIGSRTLKIVGIVEHSTALANQPNAFLTVTGAQQLIFGGQPLISSIGIKGTPDRLPEGFKAMDRDGAAYDMMRPLKSAVDAISLMAVLLWVVAALIVGSLIYLSAMERMRDFAVFKAVGVTSRAILGGLVLQAVLVAILAAAVGVVVSKLLAPLFPMQVVVPGLAFLLLPVVAVGTGLVASGAGLRRVVTVDPALAFGSK